MNRNTKPNALVPLICTALMLCLISGGCAGTAKRNDKMLPESRTGRAKDESSFAAGSGRSPTAETAYSYAKILVSQGRNRDALYVLSHIIREHPKFLPAYNEMAGVYMRADRLDDAIATITLALEQSPNDAVLHNNLGMCYLLKEEPQKALASFTRATEAVPNSATFRSNRAAALALTAHDVEAESEYRTVLGTLQARQNVVALAKARDSRSDAIEQHGDGNRPAKIQKDAASAEHAPPAVAPKAIIETPAPSSSAAPALMSVPDSKVAMPAPMPSPSPLKTSAAKTSAVKSIIEIPAETTTIETPVTVPAGETAIHTLAGAAAIDSDRPTAASPAQTADHTPWIAPVPNDLIDKAADAPDAPAEPI